MSENTIHSDNPKKALMYWALQEFAEKGYDGASLRDICHKANQNVSAVKYYFGGKEELYRSCILEFGETRLSEVARILTQPENFEEFKLRLKLFAEDFIISGMQNRNVFKVVCREIENQNPIFKEIFHSTLMKIHQITVNYFQTAVEKNFIRPEVDHLILTCSFMDGIVQRVRLDHLTYEVHHLTLKDAEYRKKFIDQYLSIFLNGIKKN